MWEGWLQQWLAVAGINKLRTVKDTVRAWNSSSCRTRRNQVILTRLRIGHTRLTHEYLMTRQEPPICEICNARLTVTHVLLECTRYLRERKLYITFNDISSLLNDNQNAVSEVLTFLKAIGLDKTM